MASTQSSAVNMEVQELLRELGVTEHRLLFVAIELVDEINRTVVVGGDTCTHRTSSFWGVSWFVSDGTERVCTEPPRKKHGRHHCTVGAGTSRVMGGTYLVTGQSVSGAQGSTITGVFVTPDADLAAVLGVIRKKMS